MKNIFSFNFSFNFLSLGLFMAAKNVKLYFHNGNANGMCVRDTPRSKELI